MAVNNNQMSKLTPEIEKQISDRADELTLKMPIDNDYQVGYVQGFIAGHEAGATEWAGRAQILFDTLEKIVCAPVPANGDEYISWFVTAKNIASGAISEYEAIIELAKYKEVSNG